MSYAKLMNIIGNRKLFIVCGADVIHKKNKRYSINYKV